MSAKICVIGGGRWGENHIRTLHDMGCLAAVVEPDAARLAELTEKYSCVGHGSVEKAAQARYGGYVVSAPAELHYSIGKLLLSAGLPTLMEKPMTLSSEESLELVKLAKANNTQLMVAHILLFHPAIRKIKELIDDDKIGELYYLYSTRIKFGTIRTEENVFWSFAPHDIAVLNYLVGAPAEKMDFTKGNFLQSNICDYAMAQLEYANNVKAHIFVSWLHPFKEQRLVAVGSKGMIWFDDAGDKQVRLCDKHVEWNDGAPSCAESESVVVPYEKKMPLDEELKYFVSHLDKPGEISTGEDGYNVVKILENAQN